MTIEECLPVASMRRGTDFFLPCEFYSGFLNSHCEPGPGLDTGESGKTKVELGRVKGEDKRESWPCTLAAYDGNALGFRSHPIDHCISRLEGASGPGFYSVEVRSSAPPAPPPRTNTV